MPAFDKQLERDTALGAYIPTCGLAQQQRPGNLKAQSVERVNTSHMPVTVSRVIVQKVANLLLAGFLFNTLAPSIQPILRPTRRKVLLPWLWHRAVAGSARMVTCNAMPATLSIPPTNIWRNIRSINHRGARRKLSTTVWCFPIEYTSRSLKY